MPDAGVGDRRRRGGGLGEDSTSPISLEELEDLPHHDRLVWSLSRLPPKSSARRRRSGSAHNNLLGSGSGTRKRPIAPGESGPCCQDSPTCVPFRWGCRPVLASI